MANPALDALLKKYQMIDPTPQASAVGSALQVALGGNSALASVPRNDMTFRPRTQLPDFVRGHSGPSGLGGGRAPGGWAQTIANQFGLRHTSGYRDPHANRKAGGVPNSKHTRRDAHGNPLANDYVGSMAQMKAAREWALANGAEDAIIHDAGSGLHLHVEYPG